MGTFTFGRSEGFPAQYPARERPVTVDITETILIVIFVIITVSYFSIVPGHSKKRSIYVSVKVAFSMLIGCLIMVENFGQEWETGGVKTMTPYRAGEKHEIESWIGLKVGLRSVNITLRGHGEEGTPLEKETINYNERFLWTWDQGRFGFGPYAGLLQRSLRAAQRRGLPIPILWVAEYFTIDGEGIRYGRFYRTAGWYSHILLWTAFATWILTNIFLQSVGRYTAYFLAMTGGLQILSCIVWVNVHNPFPLVIPFADGAIKMQLGVHFWMTIVCGLLCLILAAILIFMDLRHPDALSVFLGIDPLDQYDECVVRLSELDTVMRTKGNIDNTMEMTDVVSDDGQPNKNNGMMLFKRRSTIRNAQKGLFRPPVPVQIDNYEDIPIYENQAFVRTPSAENKRSSDIKVKMTESKKPPIPKRIKKPTGKR